MASAFLPRYELLTTKSKVLQHWLQEEVQGGKAEREEVQEGEGPGEEGVREEEEEGETRKAPKGRTRQRTPDSGENCQNLGVRGLESSLPANIRQVYDNNFSIDYQY